MHLVAHSISALPFLATGSWLGALGAVAPDITWLYAEYKYRRSGIKSWHEWAEQSITPLMAMPYRLAHSLLIVPVVCFYFGWHEFLLGWSVHIAMDLPTHGGIMRQQPFYPFKWRWRWVLKSYC